MAALVGNYCPTSGKECFDSRFLAQKAMSRLNKKSSKSGSVYLCPDCGKWHITHHSYSHSKDINSKRKKDMAGIGRFKIGAELRFKDNLGNYLKCGDYVRHIITEKEGVITQYGVVKGSDGTNYKLCDNFWEVVTKKEEPIDLNVGEMESEVHELIGEHKKKTLADFSTDEIVAWVVDLAVNGKLTAPNEVALTDIAVRHGYDDKFLAEELRRRGYEVSAEKTVKISL